MLDVVQNIGTIVTTYYLSAWTSHVVMVTDKSMRLGLTNEVHRVKVLLKSKLILY